MTSFIPGKLKRTLLLGTILAGSVLVPASRAQQVAAAGNAEDVETVIVSSQEGTRSAVEISGLQAQKILPGVSPLKAIQTLPGVVYETADPWGNNEQNESLVVHGFTTQQLGYTMDGVPLGDQQYGNYNGLSVSRAVTSENVSRTILSSGAGALGVASTSNLGGAIETFSTDPAAKAGVDFRQTLGSYDATRTFLRLDTGELGNGFSAYISGLYHDARAWDFQGHQKDEQINLKLVQESSAGRLTFYADFGYKVEPNEDATGFGNQQSCAATAPASCASFHPYTRPFLFPNIAAGLAYLTNGTPPPAYGSNFSNYDSAAQRLDALTYLKYDWRVADGITWSNQVYYHHDTGRGIVAGPINQAGLPGLFALYFPSQVVGANVNSAGTLSNIVNTFGGTGYEVRTTEYRINRVGELSTLNWDLGDHQIEAGLWYERNASSTARRWYPFSAANNDLTPYDVPRNPAFTQYYVTLKTDALQLHLQDEWAILPTLHLQAGIKASLQTAGNEVKVNQANLVAGNPAGLPATNPPVVFPTGSITSNDWFLPEMGAVWDVTGDTQIFANVQKNLRQFVPYAAGSNFYGSSPWSLGSQAAFDQFKATAHPETAWTYEAGVRTHADIDLGPVTGISGQANYYHVNFSNRLFNIAAYNFINPGASVLVNVGGVTTDGVDVAMTLDFGEHFQLYDAVSYNSSTYDDNFQQLVGGVITTVAITGKTVPLTPDWLNKTVASFNWGNFQAQVSGDFVGRRYTTYLNDLQVPGTFQMGLQAGYDFDMPADALVHKLRLSGNVTNVTDTTGISTAVVTGASGGYQGYPIAPRMWFVTLAAKF